MKYLYALILVFVFSYSAIAQNSNFSIVTYNMNYSGPDTRDFVDDYNWSGFTFEFGRFTSKNLAVSLMSGWNILRERTEEVIIMDRGAVSGTQIRHLGVIPFIVNARYVFIDRDRSEPKPYVGIGFGTYWINQRLEIGIYEKSL